MKSRMPAESRPSLLLTKEENEIIFKMIGQRCQSLATAVVQLFTTDGPAHNQWFKRDTGILCLVKDNHKRSYYFRIYCMQRKTMIWEHEVYSQIEYKSPCPFLHTFEAENCIAAFNFASEDEAMNLKNNLIEKIELKKRRGERRIRSMQSATRISTESSKINNVPNSTLIQNNRHGLVPINNNSIPPTIHMNHNHDAAHIAPAPQKGFLSNYNIMPGSKKAREKRKLTKADIGLPKDFTHVSHIRWDAEKGFDIGNLPEEDMKTFFSKAGVSETQLNDASTRDFIYDFIKSHGGADAVKKDVKDVVEVNKIGHMPAMHQSGRAPMPPPIPIRNPGAPTPVPVAKDTNGTRHVMPAPPVRAPPPPPPPVPHRQLPTPPPPMGGAGAPPPPPPPPIPAMQPASIDTSSPIPQAPAPPDMHSALLDSIRGGKSLRHVDVEKKPVVDDKRGDLLSEIRQGLQLRAVTVNSSDTDRKSLSAPGLAGALARALEERSKVMHSDSSDSDADDTISDGDEWED